MPDGDITEFKEFRDILTPVKDPEKSFTIEIAEVLQHYIHIFVHGRGTLNFNSAALLLQSCSCIYAKKVEHIHNLATKLLENLKNKKADQAKKDSNEKHKGSKENRFKDPFCSTDVKPGKNLSCLSKRNIQKVAATKKGSKKGTNTKFEFVPVDLLPLEGEEKGDVFYDVHGDAVGNKGDYTLNKCTVTTSGWLLLPTVSCDLIPDESSDPDYSLEHIADVDNGLQDDSDSEMPQATPCDEGYPASSGSPSDAGSTPSSQALPSSQATDEGLGSLPCTPQDSQGEPVAGPSSDGAPEEPMEVGDEDLNRDGIENIPVEDVDVAPKPRRSMRQALKLCQIPPEEDEPESPPPQQAPNPAESQAKEIAAVKKKIQKKNTRNLPARLRNARDENALLNSVPSFCARTFFAIGAANIRNYIALLEISAFAQNAVILNSVMRIIENNKRRLLKKKLRGEVSFFEDEEDEDGAEELEVNEIERRQDAEPDEGEVVIPNLDQADIVIENNPEALAAAAQLAPPLPQLAEDDDAPLAPMNEDPLHDDDFSDFEFEFDENSEKISNESLRAEAEMQVAQFRADIRQYVQVTDLSTKVREWERSLKPFLDSIKEREAFDINQYGSRILNNFKDSNRKQTITFRDFCKGKEKWEIHRYFMALLPLVNVGNISIETELMSDGEEDILMTLLSRKMHHKELEEFGHSEGEHDE